MSLLAPAIKAQPCGIFISLSSERSLDACEQPTFLHPPVIKIIKNFLSYIPAFSMVGYRQMHGITVYVHAAPLPASRFYCQANKHVRALPNTERFQAIIIDDDTKVLAN